MPWGLAVAAGGLISNVVGSSNAASAAEQGSQNAINEQQREFNIIQGDVAPQHALGTGAMGLLGNLFGIGGVTNAANPATAGTGGGPNMGASPILGGAVSPYSNFANNAYSLGGPGGGMGAGGAVGAMKGAAGAAPGAGGGAPGQPNYSSFYNQPGYQFTLQQGMNAVNRNAAANGGLYSANTLTGEANYAEGAASTQYNNYVNQLLSMSGLGNSANQTLATAGVATGEGESNSMISAGNANASGVLGTAGAFSNAAYQLGQNGGGIFGNYGNGNNSYSAQGGTQTDSSGYTTNN